MNWVAILFWIITHAPELIKDIRLLIDLFRSLPAKDGLALKTDLATAIQTGDKQAVKASIERCKTFGGIGCAADTKNDG
jgi:hypothetical protein